MKVLNSPVIISTLKIVQEVQACLCCIHTFLGIKYLHLKGYIVYLGFALRRKEKKEKTQTKGWKNWGRFFFYIIFCVKCVCPGWVMHLPYTLFVCVCIVLSSDNVIFCHTFVFFGGLYRYPVWTKAEVSLCLLWLFWLFITLVLSFYHPDRGTSHCLFFDYLFKQKRAVVKTHSHTYMNLWWREFRTTLLNQSKHKNKQQSKGNC